MKTAISIPNDVFRAAEAFAKQQGMSRSQVFAVAMQEFLTRHRKHQSLLENLNSVYTQVPEHHLDDQARAALLALEWDA